MQAADQKKRDDMAWLREQKGRRLVDGQRLEAEGAAPEQAVERPAEKAPAAAAETPTDRARREAREQKLNGWIKESTDVLTHWTRERAKIAKGGLTNRDGSPNYEAFDPDFVDRVMEKLREIPGVPETTGRESQSELLAREAVRRAHELLAAARVLEGIQTTIRENVAKWKAEGLNVIDDRVDWEKVA